MASFPEGTSQSPKCRQITLDFHHGGAEIQSHGNIYSGYRLTFPASTTIRGLTRMPYLPSYLLHSIVSDQETSYHSKEDAFLVFVGHLSPFVLCLLSHKYISFFSCTNFIQMKYCFSIFHIFAASGAYTILESLQYCLNTCV